MAARLLITKVSFSIKLAVFRASGGARMKSAWPKQ
jgi:hypothetical protein